MGDKPIKIGIKDFQAIKKANLEIPSGLTVITGATNNGKSAILRAIEASLFNQGDDSMVRAGKPAYGVIYDNGEHKMLFTRSSAGKNEKSAYQFDDGTVQKKVGRSQLPEVIQYFNIRDVRMQNGTKVKLNFWKQNEKPFLMDKTSGQLYEFISMSSCDKYAKVVKKMEADTRELKGEIAKVSTEIDTYKLINNDKRDFLTKNKGFDKVYYSVRKLEQEYQKEKSLKKAIEFYQSNSSKVENLENTLQSIRKKDISYSQKVAELQSFIASYEKSLSLYEKTSNYFKEFEVTRNSLNTVLGKLKPIYEKEEKFITRAKNLGNEIFQFQESVENKESLTEKFNKVKSLHDRMTLNSLEESKISSVLLKDTVEQKDLNQVVKLVNLKESLKKLFDSLSGDMKRLSKLDSSLSGLEEDSNSLSKEIEFLKEKLQVCPVCGSVLHTSHRE